MEQIDARQELAFIKKVMADSRQVVVDNGLEMIVWGAIVTFGMYATFLLHQFKASQWRGGGLIYLWLWILVMGSGWVYSLIRYRRNRVAAKAVTLAGRIMNALWLGCGVVIMLFIFIGMPLQQVDTSPAIAAVLGIGFFVSGVLLDFRPMRWVGFGWWAVSGVMFSFWRLLPRMLKYEMLFFGTMMLLLQVVPGIVLYRRWKRDVGGEAQGQQGSSTGP